MQSGSLRLRRNYTCRIHLHLDLGWPDTERPPGLVFAALFYPAFTTAVTAPEEQSLIEEVVVTAAKREQGIYEVSGHSEP